MVNRVDIKKWNEEIDNYLKSITKELKNKRKELKITQEQVNRDLKLHRTWLSAFENGKMESHKIENIILLCKYYDYSFYELLLKVRKDYDQNV
ncbi:helix-turn-helix domain-containing protein [Staphylococcus aureus]|uniref:helix-turn-helix domain-containing protein n=1 Tax=Staphylococcus aureus TaxID=1280 RepID=UPI0016547624|nr:helix-turn-helix transcriptional regulator [Staphylococcus aureus]EHD0803049.1 helix-turn-helix transcriptional regulator [Staphylococcus pseudintermedius]HCT0573271.1 helix-turn-helix transcriptional regulator [Staphylococcus pseudintermedius]HDK4771686.1 helix-turn-helix transcriptional regulator [Staphylococcus aureus]HDK4782622.1 helix-turn-helix transcriptional regulator [Staphylococcus aureus]